MARGPGPTAEIAYSPTLLSIPPRSIGKDHSLTDISQTDFGNRAMMSTRIAVAFPAPVRHDDVGLGVPAVNSFFDDVATTSAMISVSVRDLQCSQDFHVAMRGAIGQIFRRRDRVDAAQVGHLRNTYASASAIHLRTAGCEVQRAVYARSSRTPAISGRFLKKDVRHRPRLVHVEIHADAVFLGPFHQGSQIGQATLVIVCRTRETSCRPAPGLSARHAAKRH